MKKVKKILNLGLVAFLGLPTLVFAETSPGGPGGSASQPTPRLDSPFKQFGDDFTLVKFIDVILENIVIPIGAVVVTFFIIYTGFMFVVARGNPEKLSVAKQAFLWTVVGAAVLLGSLVISGVIDSTIKEITG